MSIETLRPSGVGFETSIASQHPDSTFHWDKVDEADSDGDTTYVYTGADQPNHERDLYALPAHSEGSGTINSVKVCALVRSVSQYSYGTLSLRTHSVTYDAFSISTSTTYTLQSHTWTENPNTEAAWTWDEIDALEIGLQLSSTIGAYEARCTQVYVEIDYTLVAVGRSFGYIIG